MQGLVVTLTTTSPSPVILKPAQQEKELQRLLRQEGFKNYLVNCDGNCMFRSIACHILNDPEQHVRINISCLKQISQNSQYYQDFVNNELI